MAPAANFPPVQTAGYQFFNAGASTVPNPGSIVGGQYTSVKQYRAAQRLRSFTPLPKRAEEIIDDAVIRVGRQRLALADDLISDASRRVSLPNWMSVPTYTSHKQGEAGRAQTGFIPTNPPGERAVQQYTPYTVPVPVIYDYFSYDIRTLQAASRHGSPIDTIRVEMATRNVLERVEDLTLKGDYTDQAANGLNGALDTTNTYTYIDSEAWTAAGHSGKDIVDDVQNMAGVLRTDKFYGPYDLYVSTTYDNELNSDYGDGTTTFDKTIRERIEQLNYNGPIRVRAADQLDADTTLLVDRSNEVARMLVGQQPAAVSFDSLDGFAKHFYVLACFVPIIQSNSESNFGICKGATS